MRCHPQTPEKSGRLPGYPQLGHASAHEGCGNRPPRLQRGPGSWRQHYSTHPRASEAYRGLRTSIHFSAPISPTHLVNNQSPAPPNVSDRLLSGDHGGRACSWWSRIFNEGFGKMSNLLTVSPLSPPMPLHSHLKGVRYRHSGKGAPKSATAEWLYRPVLRRGQSSIGRHHAHFGAADPALSRARTLRHVDDHQFRSARCWALPIWVWAWA